MRANPLHPLHPQRTRRCTRGPGKRLLTALMLVSLAPITLMLHGCNQGETPVHVSQFDAFGTRVDMQLLGVSEQLATEIAQQTATDFGLVEYALGLDQPGPMQRTNELLATTDPFAAPPSLLPLLKQSQTLAARSGHLFNPAIGLLTQLWRPDPVTGRCEPPPDAETIARILEAQPRLTDLSLNGIELLSDNPAVKLDFGAVTRAYATDLAITNMRARGMRGAMIRIGTDLRLLGDRAGQPWRIPVLRGSGGAVLGTLSLRGDTSIITIGRFQKPCVRDGEHYPRTIDPRTGYPAKGTQMVTVVHPGDAVSAAAAAAALFVAGPEHWGQVGKRMGITAALLIDETGQIHLSPAMARLLQIIDRNAQVSLSPAWQDSGTD
ncbi:FAD:protein FMN transferase [Thiorhodovibrio frisius]|uniref:FAD:protein FMN transferase n=1 Tax=Thiorhodovibrio frisius TaxID=631362 RepID=H8Z3M8_9GAMM|nr:FAD:protein FMN transferase [Thiorhodovibrio frisius]EIC20017.1 membrane-associated lipoprotein involved in thiamine biosynthesis [Thiorhodovibrio frisius]WPL20746.1 Thiamine biosynthesis lipoprotein ApbE precursor [Thiorhodovibrio frisius]